jgi:Protein of unknown function (DUF4238)
MGPTRKQHYVPQFYLKRFTHRGRQLFVHDKVTGKTFPASISDVAQEAFFYDIPPEAVKSPVDLQAVEKALARLEWYHGKTTDRVLALEEGQTLSEDDVYMMAHMILVQHARTRDSRNLAVELCRKTVQDLANELVQRNYPPEDWRLTPTVVCADWAAGLLLSQKILDASEMDKGVQVLVRRFWTVRVNKTERPFITSDNPIAIRVIRRSAATQGFGPCSPGVEVAFPLSSDRLLVITDKLPEILRKNGMVLRMDPDQIRLYNGLQVISSHRQLFGRTADFSLAEQMCGEDPSLRSEADDRVRIANFAEEMKTTILVSVHPRQGTVPRNG